MTSFVIFDLVNDLSFSFRRRCLFCSYNSPISFIGTLVEVFEEILKEVDRSRPLEVDMAVIFCSEEWNVQYYIPIFRLATARFKIA